MGITTHVRRSIAGLAVLAAVATACGGDEAPIALSFADDAPLVDPPGDAAFSPEIQRIIDFHADWLCELQRRTFTDLTDADTALTEALATAEIGDEEYELFSKDVLTTQPAREAVRYAYQENCRAK